MENLLTRKELLKVLDVSNRTLARMIEAGMPRRKEGWKGHTHLYSIDDITRWVDARTVEGKSL